MTKVKKLIIFLIIIVLIILIAFVIYRNRGKLFHGIEVAEDNYVYEEKPGLQRVNIRNNYYIVKNNVTKFYTEYINAYNIEDGYKIIDEDVKKTIEQQQKKCAEKLYAMLDKQYIEDNEITNENILSKLGKIGASEINITDMYVSEKNIRMSAYLVYGTLRNKKTSEISEFSMIVKVDSANKTFSIFMKDYVEKHYNNIKEGNILQIDSSKTIEKNDHNTYEYKHISDSEYVDDLFNQYKEEILFNPELVYSKLDEEYKNKKFDSLEAFIQYTKNNIRQNVVMSLNEYKKENEDGYTRYVCLDKNGNSYIFSEESVMNYTLILDTYTIDLPEFIENYYGIEPTNKVALNIQKIFDAMNDKDYKYVYSKMAEGFKQNYFPTLESFEEYAKENFFENNIVDYLYYQKESEEYYSYTIKVLDEDSDKSKVLKIIMYLKETTQFEFSFNVN